MDDVCVLGGRWFARCDLWRVPKHSDGKLAALDREFDRRSVRGRTGRRTFCRMAGLARAAAPSVLTDETRASITMHAELCTPRDWNILNIRYEQLYPEQNSITAHSARDRIVCTLSRATDPQGLTSISTRCEHTVRKMLSYPGIDEPVELVSHDYQLGFELAERFLGFLSGYVAQAVHGRELARGEFRGIDRIHAFEGSGSNILFTTRAL